MAERLQLWLLGHRSRGSGLLGRFSSKSDSEVSYKLFEVALTVTGSRSANASVPTSAVSTSSPTRMQDSLQHINPSKQEYRGYSLSLSWLLSMAKPR